MFHKVHAPFRYSYKSFLLHRFEFELMSPV